MNPKRVLIIDDDTSQLRLLARWLEHESWEVVTRRTGAEGIAALQETLPDVLILDLYLDGEDGMTVLDTVIERHPNLPVVMLTSETSVDVVVQAMQRGAYDYLTKPMARTKVVTTVRNALEKAQLTSRVRILEREVGGGGFGGILGESEVMKRLFRQLDRVAPADVTVLVQGESGTGKELVAQALHNGSGRASKPFVAINCAAIAESLQESELFGHEKGAFTGADARRAGRFEQADGGTLFLDEVGELSLGLQAKLLRVLQERSFYRVGGNTRISVDVRIVAATHKDLEAASQAGSFREDLFYRLAVFELMLPPLRERGEDVVLLAEALLATECARHGRELVLGHAVREVLLAYAWPGNVRELSNAMARAAVASEGPEVGVEDLPRRLRANPEVGPSDAGLKPIESVERQAIVEAISASKGNLSEAMRRLGIPRTTFYRRLKKFGIDA